MGKKFTTEQNRMLTEVYRKLNYFVDNTLDTQLLVLDLPSKIKCLKDIGFVTSSSGRETPRIYNWYKLTDKGKSFFKHFILDEPLSDKLNSEYFEGISYINFNNLIKPTDW